METTSTFTINVVGEESGDPYTGTFKVKTLLSRRDVFAADEKRRMIVGGNATTVLPTLATESFVLGQLFVRILEAPKWWTDSNHGIDLDDANVSMEIFSLAVKAEQERKDAIVQKSTAK